MTAIYDVHLFPSFAKLQNHPNVSKFIEEAILVRDTLPINSNCIRLRNEWDDIASTSNLLTRIRETDNSHWIISQHRSDWLNYPLMYYDNEIGKTPNKLCPTIMQFLRETKNIRIAGFSLMKPGGVLEPHTDSTGRSKDSLACHVCLTGQGELVVDGHVIPQVPHNVFIFDSEFTHSARNTGTEDRIIFFIDFIYSKHVNAPMNVILKRATKKQIKTRNITFLQYLRELLWR